MGRPRLAAYDDERATASGARGLRGLATIELKLMSSPFEPASHGDSRGGADAELITMGPLGFAGG
jgi:hypothetical protein